MIQRWRAPSRMKLPASAWLCKKTSSGSGGDRAPGPDTLPPFYRKIYGVVRRVARPGVPEACEIVAVEHFPVGTLTPPALILARLGHMTVNGQKPAVIPVDQLGIPARSMCEPRERRHVETRLGIAEIERR